MTTQRTVTRIVRFDEFGGPDVLTLEEIPLAEPGPDEVRIKVQAMSLNRADALFRSNNYVIQPTFPGSRIGTDAAGIIEKVGSEVEGLKIGDRVIAGLGFDISKHGTHGESAILPARFVHTYPEFLTPAEAASVNNPFVTAWGALVDQGEMAGGDFVLITAGSSSVGVAAIQLARAAGAVPIAVTRNESKREALIMVGASHVIATESEDLSERVREITGGKGARLVFDAVGGATLQALDAISADGGIVFLYGAFDLGAHPVPMIPAITKELRLWGYMVYSVHNSPQRLQRALEYIFDLMKTKGLRPVIDRIFPLAEYADAHRHLESNQQVGRIVVTV